jgi:nucleoside 2-deoxyribosyltransferase
MSKNRIYFASGFFNPFEIMVKQKMIKAIKTKFPDAEYFDPQETDNSKKFNPNDKDHGEELARAIYQDNIREITNCDILVFPKGTQDLGTLCDLGTGIKLGKEIWRYDYLDNSLTKLGRLGMDLQNNDVVNVNSLSAGILLGYNFDNTNYIYYVLGEGLSDNIMMRMKYTRLTTKNGKVEVEDTPLNESKLNDEKVDLQKVENEGYHLVSNPEVKEILGDSDLTLVTSVS